MKKEPSATDTPTEDPEIEEHKGGSSFWNGVLVGVAVWVGIIVVVTLVYCFCCKNRNSDTSVADQAAYSGLAGS